jgi:hypothetical protein
MHGTKITKKEENKTKPCQKLTVVRAPLVVRTTRLQQIFSKNGAFMIGYKHHRRPVQPS